MENEMENFDGSMAEALVREISRLNARAANLQMKARLQSKELARRRDAHEKIILGACVKKVGLDSWCRRSDASTSGTAGFDVPLLLGALVHLASQLEGRIHGASPWPDDEQLRRAGSQSLGGGLRKTAPNGEGLG